MGIASWWAWWPTGEERLKRRRGEVRRAVEDEESDVEDALALAKRAAESTEHLDAAKNEAESALSDLKQLGDRVECADGDTLDWIEEEVKALDLRRAYILPAKALPIEATARESEAQDWGLPSQGLGRLKSRGDQVRQLPESETQRMWFWWFLDEYHYWDGYLDWYG